MARVQGMTPEGIRKAIAEAISFIEDLNVEDLNKLLAAFEDANGIFDLRLVEVQEEVKKAGDKALEAEEQARLIVEELARHQELQEAESARILSEVAIAIQAANLASDRIPDLLQRMASAEESLAFANSEFSTLIIKQDEFLDTVAEQTAEISRLNTEFVAVNQTVGEAVDKVDQSTIKVNQIGGDLELARTTLDAKIKKSQEDISAAQKVADEHQNAIETLVGNLGGLTTEHTTLASNFSAEVKRLTEADSSQVESISSLAQNVNTKVDELRDITDAQAGEITAAKNTAAAAKTAADSAITNSVIQYAVASSETVAPTAGWSTATPTKTPGSYIWMRTVITYGSGNTKTTAPVPVTGNDGQDGDKGDKGATGATGLSLTSVTPYFQLVLRGVTPPAKPTVANPSGWVTKEPDWVSGRELYRTEKVLYSNGTFSYTEVSKVSSYTAADKGISDAAAATQALETYKTDNNVKVQKALGDAAKGISDAAAANSIATGAVNQLPAMNTAISSAAAEAKKANDALPAIRTDISNVSTRISTATGNLTALESDVASKVAALQATDQAQAGEISTTNSKIDNLQIGGRNLLYGSAMPKHNSSGSGITAEMTPEGLKVVVGPVNQNFVSFSRSVVGPSPAGDSLKDGDQVTFSIEIKSEDSTYAPTFYAKPGMNYLQMKGNVGAEFTKVYVTRTWVRANVWNLHLGFSGKPGTYIIRNFKLERGNRATDWTPAPEEIDADVAKAQSDATKAIGDAKAAADKLPAMVTATSNAAAEAKKANDALPAIRSDISGLTTSIGTTTGNLSSLQSDVNSKVAALQATDQAQAGEISTAKSQAAQGISDAATAKAAVDNLQIGGRNLVIRAGEMPGWLDGSGNHANTSGHFVMRDHISVTPGETLTFTKQGASYFRWNWYDEAQNYIDRKPDGRNEFQWVVPNNAHSIWVSYPAGSFPKIERGNKPTDWTPAPEDVDASVKTALDEAKAATGALPAINTSLSDASSKANQAVAALPGLTTGLADAQKQADKGVSDASTIREAIRIKDTRSVENMPIDYWRQYPMTPVKEFTRMGAVRLVDPRYSENAYIYLDIMIPWTDASGGPVIQTARRGSDIRNTWTRHSIGSGENATWSEWKSEFNDIQASVSTLNTKAAELTTGLSNAATQEQYNALNTRLWGNQGEINTINATFQTQQNQINANNAAFQTWQTDINTKRGKWEDGATLALQHLTDFTTQQTKWNKASTDATNALTNAAAAQKSFNDNQLKWNTASTNATKALADLTTEQGKVLALQTELNTKRDKWESGATLAIDNLTNFSVRQDKWNKASTDATKALSDAAAAQKVFNDNQLKWNTASTNATKALSDLTTEQGKVLALQNELNSKRDKWESGATLAIDNLTDFATKQTKWNKASTDATAALTNSAAATTQAVAAHQRLIEMVYPDQLSLVPMVPGGVNTGTSAKPVYRQEPSWRQGGVTATVNGTADMTDKLGLKYTAYKVHAPETKNTVPVRTQDVGFSVWVYASAVNTHMIFTLADDTNTRCVQQTVIKEGIAAGTHVGYVFDTRKTGTLPVGWRKIEGVITLKAGTKAIRTESIYFNYPHGDAGVATQYFVDLKMWPIIPAQADVNEALTKAVDSHAALFEGQNKWNAVATAAIESQATLLAKQARWSDGVDKALAWQDQLNNSQSDINKTTTAVLANQAKWNSAQLKVNDSQSEINRATQSVLLNQSKWNTAQEKVNNDQSELNKAVKVVQDKQTAWNNGVTKALAAHDELFVSTSTTFKAVKAVQDNQTKWNKVVSDLVTTNSNVSAANKTAIEGLNRVLGLRYSSSNVIPMVPGGVRTGGTDLAPVFTPTPGWMTKGTRVTVTDIPGITSIDAIQQTGQATHTFTPYYSEIDPTIEYKYSYWAKADVASTRIYIELRSGESTSFPVESNTQDNHSSAGQYLAGNVLLAVGWKQYTGTIRFKPETRTIYVNRIYYSHPNGVSGTQTIADIQIYPNIPSQADVNKALTDSDAAQNTLLAKQELWNEASSRSIATVENLWGKTTEEVGFLNTLTDELGEKISQQSKDFAKNISQLFNFIPRIAFAQDGQNVPASETDGFIKITRTKSGSQTTQVAVEAVGNWVGSLIIEGDHGKSGGQDQTFLNYTPIRVKRDVITGTRIFNLYRSTSVDHIGSVKVTFFVDPGEVRAVYPSGTNSYPDPGLWRVLTSDPAPETSDYNISLNVTWAATTYGDKYGIRIRSGTTVVAEILKDKVGPLLPGESGVRTMNLNKTVKVYAGRTIYLEAYSNASQSPQRRISKWHGQISYITSGRG